MTTPTRTEGGSRNAELDSTSELALLSFAARLLLSQLDRRLLLERGLESFLDFARGRAGSVFLLDARGESLHLAHGIGIDGAAQGDAASGAGADGGATGGGDSPASGAGSGPDWRPVGHSVAAPGESPWRDALASRVPRCFRLDPIAASARPSVGPGVEGRDCLCVALLGGANRVLGVVAIDRDARDPLEEGRLQSLIVLQSIMALGLEEAAARERLLGANEELEGLYAAKSKMIDHLSHELKTPLSVLSASIALLGRAAVRRDDARAASVLERMERGLQRLLELQEEACDIAEADAGVAAAQEIALESWVPEVLASIAPLHRRRAVRVETELVPTPPVVLPEPLLRKALIGIVRNAIEATADGGWVRVATGRRAGGVSLEVEDSGTGFDEATRKQLFHGFVHAGDTSDYSSRRAYDFGAGGRGLDLLRTRHFADRQGFAIEVESEPGKGSRFRLVFPEALLGSRLQSASAPRAPEARVGDRSLDVLAPSGTGPGGGDDFFREISIPLLAHELKGPLAVVETGIRTLLERGGGESEARRERTLRRVLRGALRARALVDDLLEVGRAEAGREEGDAFRPVAVVTEALLHAVEAMDGDLAERLAAASEEALIDELRAGGVDFTVSDRARAIVVEQDARRYSLVVANLARNALRFKKHLVELRLDVEGETVRLWIEDDGPGVAAEDRERVFERWARGAPAATGPRQGHGLGLAAARILARGMGGEVSLEGEEGSRFVFAVPLRGPGRSL